MSHKENNIRNLTKLYAGDSIYFQETLSDYAGWTLTYYLNGPEKIPITSTEDPSGLFTVDVSTTITAGYLPGHYTWTAVATSGTERDVLYNGVLEILPDPVNVAASDQRTHAQKVLEAIEAVLEDRATKDQQSYTINGRTLARSTLEELTNFRSHYKALVVAEQRRERARKGLPTSAKIKVRL